MQRHPLAPPPVVAAPVAEAAVVVVEEVLEVDPLPSLDHSFEPTFPTLGEALTARPEPAAPPVGPHRIPLRFAPTEALMDQARSYVCKKCYSPVPHGHKFCGR